MTPEPLRARPSDSRVRASPTIRASTRTMLPRKPSARACSAEGAGADGDDGETSAAGIAQAIEIAALQHTTPARASTHRPRCLGERLGIDPFGASTRIALRRIDARHLSYVFA